MPRYIYTAKSHPYKKIRSFVEAETNQEAINKITSLGYFPISVETEKINLGRQKLFAFKKISNKDIIYVTYQLSRLVESGVNILNSLKIIASHVKNKYLRTIVEDIKNKIKQGASLSEGMSAHTEAFSGLYISMIRSGETGGNLQEALKHLGEYLEKEEEFKNSVRAALTYPFFVLIMSVITIGVLMGFVIPRLLPLFTEMNRILPLPTRIIINLAEFTRRYWWNLVLLFSVAIFLSCRLYRNPRTRLHIDAFKLRVPVLGNVILKTELTRLTRTLSLLLCGGIPLVAALETALLVIENKILNIRFKEIKEHIASGKSFSQGLNESPQLNLSFISDIIKIGEETGSLEKSLFHIAEDFEKQTNHSLKTMVQFIEPVMILGMGLIIGFIVLSMLLPIFQINLMVK